MLQKLWTIKKENYMIEKIGNIWDFPADATCVTTNGIVKKNGDLVMGAGIALEAKLKYPILPTILGGLVKSFGNHCFHIPKLKIISFPTKNHFKDNSTLELIEESASILKSLTDMDKLNIVALPRPGCGLGNLKWENVKPILEKYLDDRFFVFHNQ